MNENEMNYWHNYYLSENAPMEPSDFARFSFNYINKGTSLLDLGCGNGRDSIYFAINGLSVTCIDQAKSGLDLLRKVANKNRLNININNGDFVTSDVLTNGYYDNIYSRFTIHSISKEQENLLINNVYNALKNNGKFFIEVRSIKDEIYGKGKKIAHNTYLYGGHLRRFIVMDDLIENLKSFGFTIEYSKEDSNFAIYNKENPVCIRIIAKK